MSKFRRVPSWEQPPFWEQRRGGGPIMRWTARQQCRAERAQRVIQPALSPKDEKDEKEDQAAIQREREMSRDRSLRVVKVVMPHCSIHGFGINPNQDLVSQMTSSMTLESGLITEKLKG